MKTRIVAFIFGAAAGSVITWFVTKKYYEKIAQEEIDSVTEVFSKRHDNTESESEPEQPEESDADISEDESEEEDWDQETKLEYLQIASQYADDLTIEERSKAKPVVISPDEFGEDHSYDQIELVYYADGILADERDIISNIADIVGEDFESHFGEYEDDSVYIRNDRLRSEYAIIKDERSFYDVFKEMIPKDFDRDFAED